VESLQEVRIPIQNPISNLSLKGNLVIPNDPIGIVVFAHGSGSSKSSYRNQLVSKQLNENNIATLLFDLLSEEEQAIDIQLENMSSKIPGTLLNKFNVSLLAKRLSMATEWIMSKKQLEKLQVSYFASSTGGPAALMTACRYNISSIVIRSGRTDLVETQYLDQIVSPCLFIVGSKEKKITKINKRTLRQLSNVKEKELKIIQNASHLFEEEGSLETVADMSTGWLKNHFK
jgi:predicted alpha/beta-hydrolase family hydrolase